MAPKGNNLSNEQLNELIADLLDCSFIENGERKLARGAVKDSSIKFKITRQQVYRYWNRAIEQRAKTGSYHLTSLKKGSVGRKPLYDRKEVKEALEGVASESRGTVRDLAESLGISHTTAWQFVGEGVLFAHSNAIKPLLTEQHRLMRMYYAAHSVEKTPNGDLFYGGEYEEVHVDEKWFDVTPENLRMYVTNREIEAGLLPRRKTQSKRYISKVMFLAAVARPRFNREGNCVFDGKIGIWPFVHRVEAQKSSKNRPKGTLETKCVNITKDLYRDYMINKVLPAIYERFPRARRSLQTKQVVYIQQDNPNTHFKKDDKEWKEACNRHPRIRIEMKE